MGRKGGEGAEGCPCIFHLSIFVFSGSSLGSFDSREGRLHIKECKGRIDPKIAGPVFPLL